MLIIIIADQALSCFGESLTVATEVSGYREFITLIIVTIKSFRLT